MSSRQYYGGYNQSQGGFNAMCGFRQFKKRVQQSEDDNPRFDVKKEVLDELKPTEMMNEAQIIDGDPTLNKGEKMDTAFTRDDKVSGKVAGYNDAKPTPKADGDSS